MPAALAAGLLLLSPRVRADDLDEEQEKAVKAAVKAVAPSVVKIETSGGTEIVKAGRGPGVRRGVGPTTGLVVSADGYIISSAFNFANKPAQIRVTVPGLKERKVAHVVATDQTRMLTLLKITDLPDGHEAARPQADAQARDPDRPDRHRRRPDADLRGGRPAVGVGRHHQRAGPHLGQGDPDRRQGLADELRRPARRSARPRPGRPGAGVAAGRGRTRRVRVVRLGHRLRHPARGRSTPCCRA